MQLIVIDHGGATHALDVRPTSSVMEAIRAAGVNIAAQCGGCCSCATCHVFVDDEWIDRLPPRSEEEEALLELTPELRPGSRLSCQIALVADLDGLRVKLAPGSEM